MFAPKRGFLSFIKHRLDRLAIGQILRDDYLYEVHGPFIVAAPASPKPSTLRRLAARLSVSIDGLAERRPLRRRTAR